LNLRKTIAVVGAPWSVCTKGPAQYLYSGDGNGKIYKGDCSTWTVEKIRVKGGS
jgi:hypothetical protein